MQEQANNTGFDVDRDVIGEDLVVGGVVYDCAVWVADAEDFRTRAENIGADFAKAVANLSTGPTLADLLPRYEQLLGETDDADSTATASGTSSTQHSTRGSEPRWGAGCDPPPTPSSRNDTTRITSPTEYLDIPNCDPNPVRPRPRRHRPGCACRDQKRWQCGPQCRCTALDTLMSSPDSTAASALRGDGAVIRALLQLLTGGRPGHAAGRGRSPAELPTRERCLMTSEPITVRTDFGSITINNELPDTVTLAVDDQLGAQRMLVMQIDEAYQVIDGLQNAIRCALTHPSPSRPNDAARSGESTGCVMTTAHSPADQTEPHRTIGAGQSAIARLPAPSTVAGAAARLPVGSRG